MVYNLYPSIPQFYFKRGGLGVSKLHGYVDMLLIVICHYGSRFEIVMNNSKASSFY